MTVDAQDVPIEQRLSRVDSLDLEPIVYKLMHPEPGGDGPAVGRR